ncbi:hypothetical protein HJC23_003700 [Cyclotella cryptica]|uniref:Ubiquitin carboxyl-terminal hydrolase n=1 Tax=Cyclotella cryptica TaxID=29204 RepID=A0ABD3QVH3_9STRA|eukprot:CCRYP_002096-RA/>CCRYP_002096-RA protein AED:0.07 eAED:-0.08 QI:0/-1/0/1/-1/1/1/0/679
MVLLIDNNPEGGQASNHNFVSFALLLASDVAGAGLGFVLPSFLPVTWPLPRIGPPKSTSAHCNKGRQTAELGADVCETERAPIVEAGPFHSTNERTEHPGINTGISRNLMAKEPSIISIKGLRNSGQTCYANSVFQALASLSPLCAYLEQMQRHDVPANRLACELYQTVQYINGHQPTDGFPRTKRNLVSTMLSAFTEPSSNAFLKRGHPQTVMDIVARHHSQFRSRSNQMFAGTSEQQDAHEFFISLMNVLSVEYENWKLCAGSSIMDIFGHATELSATGDDKSTSTIQDGLINSQIHKVSDNKKEHDRAYDSLNNDGYKYQEEKKHDDFIHEQALFFQHAQQYSSDKVLQGTRFSNSIGLSELTENSTIQEFPFDGWLGSTIKCTTCHHIRPVRSTPFVALSLPVANNPSGSLHHFLSLEYGGFFTAERVSDVLCLSCAIQKHLDELEEEELMLTSAIASIQKRHRGSATAKQQSGRSCNEDILGLIKESQRIRARAAWLRTLDPDADEEVSDHGEFSIDEFELIQGTDKSSLTRLKPIRGDALKATLIMRPPKVFCIHAQRRHYDFRSQQILKIRHHVDFSEVLDVSDYYAYAENSFEQRQCASNNATIKNKLLYKLMSVIEHQGGAFGGHYRTYRRSNWTDDSKWVLVSDESVSPRSWDDVKSCQAYMLFYVALS